MDATFRHWVVFFNTSIVEQSVIVCLSRVIAKMGIISDDFLG